MFEYVLLLLLGSLFFICSFMSKILYFKSPDDENAKFLLLLLFMNGEIRKFESQFPIQHDFINFFQNIGTFPKSLFLANIFLFFIVTSPPKIWKTMIPSENNVFSRLFSNHINERNISKKMLKSLSIKQHERISFKLSNEIEQP